MARTLATVAATLAGLAVLGGLGGVAFVYSGIYDISAVRQHWGVTYWVLDTALIHSVRHHADGVAVPAGLDDPDRLERGRRAYRAHCVQCHGAPGMAPAPFALGLNPLPPPLAQTARDRTPAEIYWAVRNGIKMSGMPAWKYRMAEEELWAVTAFVERLALLSPADYRALAGGPGDMAQGGAR